MTEAREWLAKNCQVSQVELVNTMGTDKTVVNSARVSYANDNRVTEEVTDKDRKLIHYLAEHKHTSPFNHCFASFKVDAPIFVARQLVKHEYLVWNEVSRRYTEKDLSVFRTGTWYEQATANKQGSAKRLKANLQYMCTEIYENAMYTAFNCYTALLRTGVSREDARMVLPQSTMTSWYWSGSLGAFAKMCNLRLDSHTQHYTRDVAKLIDGIMAKKFPISWRALVK